MTNAGGINGTSLTASLLLEQSYQRYGDIESRPIEDIHTLPLETPDAVGAKVEEIVARESSEIEKVCCGLNALSVLLCVCGCLGCVCIVFVADCVCSGSCPLIETPDVSINSNILIFACEFDTYTCLSMHYQVRRSERNEKLRLEYDDMSIEERVMTAAMRLYDHTGMCASALMKYKGSYTAM